MAKKLELTPKIRGLIASASGNAVDPDKVSVYEAMSINTLPVVKRNIFEGAVHSEGTLQDMADAVNARPLKTHVPMHTMHQQNYELPVGKVFYGQVIPNENGIKSLHSYFWIPNTETEILGKLEGGAIEEVSVGVRYKHLNCSECGWDYLGDDATDDHIWERTCANGHQIGTKGVHLKLNGLDRWMEQSLVSLGAAQGAKILSRTKALLGQDTYNALIASGRDPVATTLYASATHPQEPTDMELTALIQELTTAKAAIIAKDAEIATLKKDAEQLPVLTAKVTELTAKVDTLEKTDLTKITTERAAAFTFVHGEASRLAVAAGEKAPETTATLSDLTASIEANRKKLGDRFPTGGRSQQQGSTGKEDDKKETAPPSAFKTAR